MTDTTTNAAPGWYPDGNGAIRWWSGTAWTEHVAGSPTPPVTATSVPQPTVVIPREYRTSHLFHLVMSFLTLGLWLPVWAIVAFVNASRRSR